MRTSRVKWTAHLGLALVFAAASVFAQPAPGTPAGAGGKAEARVPFGKGSQLTAQEQLNQTDAYLDKMDAVAAEVERLAQKAKEEKDIIKLNCVNDKKAQILSHRDNARQYRESLKLAASRGDDGARNHEFAKLTIAYQKVIVLQKEAEACVGEETGYVGETRVEAVVDPNITKEDPTTLPGEPVEPVEIPPVESPYK